MNHSIDSDIPNAEKANSFEVGSRSPRWRGGTDPTTKKNRVKTYKIYGIGITTASNSAAAFPKGNVPDEITLENFLDGKIGTYEAIHETSTKVQRQKILELLKRVDPRLTKLKLEYALSKSDSTRIITADKTSVSIRISLFNDLTSGKRLTTIRLIRNP